MGVGFNCRCHDDTSCVCRILKDEDRVQANISTKDSEESADAVSTIEVLRQETVATATLMASKARTKKETVAAPVAEAAAPASVEAAVPARDRTSSDVYYKDNGRKLDTFCDFDWYLI